MCRTNVDLNDDVVEETAVMLNGGQIQESTGR